MKTRYDIIVVGGGHAGCEAAHAAATMGSSVLLITMDMGKLAQMSCNPAVGGVAKGQIVREIDALGGQMGIITDRSTIQFRMLNRSKGAAMWSPRAQCDKELFSSLWRGKLQNADNLWIWQDTVSEILTENSYIPPVLNLSENCVDTLPAGHGSVQSTENRLKKVYGVRTVLGVEFRAEAVILTAGTFLSGLMHLGRSSTPGGRHGDAASFGITECLRSMGFKSGRMKTGTPARLDMRSIDFDLLEPQYGDEKPSKFSFSSETEPAKDQLPCFIANTSAEIHEILRTGFDDSPLFNGTITGIGPRYCPSIEDKLRTFADKDSHQLFLEPEGRGTNEYYLNGFSSSLPWQVQFAALSKIRGFENIQLSRPGYAIEYDYFPPTQLFHSLETKLVKGLWFAGQINGTTGYEEAAAQGLMAGINAHRSLNSMPPVILQRDQAYIGVLIDDLVTKGVDEPYRMFTSRAEHRILLRGDNADLRLTRLGHSIGLAGEERLAEVNKKDGKIKMLSIFMRTQRVEQENLAELFASAGINNTPSRAHKLYELLTRPEITMAWLIDRIPLLREFIEIEGIEQEVVEQTEIQIKYKGYIEREKFIAEKMHRLENIAIPTGFDFARLASLSTEARHKLSNIHPATLAQASRIPGVSPADINALMIYFGR